MQLIHGLSYVFECEVTGADAEADVTWTLTQNGIPDITEVDAASTANVDCLRPTDVESFSLTVDYSLHQAETLTCVAANSAGSVNHTIELDVLGK